MKLTLSRFFPSVVLVLIAVFVLSKFRMENVQETSFPSSTVPTLKESVMLDGNMTMDIRKGNKSFYWLLGHESSLSIDVKSANSKGRITLGTELDPCGRRAAIRISTSDQLLAEINQKSPFIELPKRSVRLHIESVTPVCLITSDPRVFYGAISIDSGASSKEFIFSE